MQRHPAEQSGGLAGQRTRETELTLHNQCPALYRAGHWRVATRGFPLFVLFTVMTLVLPGCGSNSPPSQSNAPDSAKTESIARARQDSINRTLPDYVVDSILPAEVELRRFRTAVGGDSISLLEDGASSRDSLVGGFIHALETSDSVALRRMLLNAREFGWLVYPESPYTRPPYTQSPALVWNQIQNPAASGFTRLVRRLAGKPLRYGGYHCSPKPDRQGSNAIWTQCTVLVAEENESVRTRRLFGSIIERDGRFKFVSYANEF